MTDLQAQKWWKNMQNIICAVCTWSDSYDRCNTLIQTRTCAPAIHFDSKLSWTEFLQQVIKFWEIAAQSCRALCCCSCRRRCAPHHRLWTCHVTDDRWWCCCWPSYFLHLIDWLNEHNIADLLTMFSGVSMNFFSFYLNWLLLLITLTAIIWDNLTNVDCRDFCHL